VRAACTPSGAYAVIFKFLSGRGGKSEGGSELFEWCPSLPTSDSSLHPHLETLPLYHHLMAPRWLVGDTVSVVRSGNRMGNRSLATVTGRQKGVPPRSTLLRGEADMVLRCMFHALTCNLCEPPGLWTYDVEYVRDGATEAKVPDRMVFGAPDHAIAEDGDAGDATTSPVAEVGATPTVVQAEAEAPLEGRE